MTRPTFRMTPSKTFDRRRFIRSATAGLALSPWIRSLAGAPAAYANDAKATRLLLFCTMGTNPAIWSPTNVSSETSFDFAPSFKPLEAVRNRLVLVEGLSSANPNNGHDAPDGLAGTGYGQATSVDQFLAQELKSKGDKSPIPVLLLGSDTDAGGGKTLFYKGENLQTIASPRSAFDTIFGAGGGGGGGGSDDPAAKAKAKRRTRALDVIKGEIDALNKELGREQARNLAIHMDSIDQLERRLEKALEGGGGGGGSCESPNRPSDSGNNLEDNLRHLDVAVAALGCGITPVAGVQFGSSQSMPVDLPDLSGDMHGGFLHSGAPNFEKLKKIETWFSEQFANLVKKMDDMPNPDGEGSLLDTSLVVWARDMGDGVVHNQKNMQFVLAGGERGYLKTHSNGRYLNGSGDGSANRHERVLLNICEAMGVSNYSGFGDPNLSGSDKTPLSAIRA